jgi:hypothetical protein
VVRPLPVTALGAGLAAAVFILYLNTLAPTVLWGDSAKLAQFVHDLDLDIRPEYHPLHTVIGRLFSYLPFGDLAFRLNLMSAFFGALTVGLIYLILLHWTRSVSSAIAGASALAVSHVHWLLSVMTETYTLFTFLLASIIWAMARWDHTKADAFLYLAAFVFGLSLCNNYLMPFFLPAFLFFYVTATGRTMLNPTRCLLLAISFVAGTSLWLGLAVQSVLSGGESLLDLFQGGAFRRYYRHPVKIVQELSRYPAYLFYQFPFVGFAMGCVGTWFQWKDERRRFTFLLLLFICDLIFASGYMRQKQFFLLLASFLVFSLWIGTGFSAWQARVGTRWDRWKLARALGAFLVILAPPVFYHSAPALVEHFRLDPVGARHLPHRDAIRFFLVPDKRHEYGAERFGRDVFKLVESGSIVVADFTPIAVLRYFQRVRGVRPDVRLTLVDFDPLDIAFVDQHIDKKPIYLADLSPDYNIAALKGKYGVIPVGPIYRVVQHSGNP